MAITFGKDGTITCTKVHTRWKSMVNLVSDSCFAVRYWCDETGVAGTNISTWVTENMTLTPHSSFTVSVDSGYSKNYATLHSTLSSGSTSVPRIRIPVSGIVEGHKYLVGFMARTEGTSSTIKVGFRSSTGTYQVYSTVVTSKVFSPYLVIINGYVHPDSQRFAVSTNVGESDFSITKVFVVDLTDTYGSGNEPTVSQLNGAVRELYNNLALTGNNVITSPTDFTVSGNGATYLYNYFYSTSMWEPRSYMFFFHPTNGTATEHTLTSKDRWAADVNFYSYYMFMEAAEHDGTSGVGGFSYGESVMFNYAPTGTYTFMVNDVGRVPPLTYSNGGGASTWKRISAFTKIEVLENPNMNVGLFANSQISYSRSAYRGGLLLTGINYISVFEILGAYNSSFSTSISESDINKEFCDRWLSDHNLPIIHIRELNDKSIKFNVPYSILLSNGVAGPITTDGYDIDCVDIVPQPERNNIYIDYKTGVIYCKKLELQYKLFGNSWN